MLTSILISALIAFLFYFCIIKPFEYWKNKGVPQGRPVWILGDSWGTFLRIHTMIDMIQMIYNQCPGTRYSGIYQYFLPTLVVKDPDLIKQVTVKDFDHFTNHNTLIPEEADPLWAKNLFFFKGYCEKWRDMRAILSPSFTSSKMKAMFLLMAECAENFVQHFLKKNEAVVSIEMKDVASRFANDVIATSAFGINVDSLENPENKFFLTGKQALDFSKLSSFLRIFGYIVFPKLFKFLKITLFDKEVGDFFINLVDETVKAREEQGIVRPDMIHLLMEARKGNQKLEENDVHDTDTGFATAQESETSTYRYIFGLVKAKIPHNITNEDIASQALIFFFAGFETVSGILCFLSYELAISPDIQERLREEVYETLEECGGKLTYEGLTKMKYMDMVVSECLRKWPVPVVTDRVCTKPYTIEPKLPKEQPLHLKKGDLLWIPMYAIHHDPQHYPDPERFDPERFSDENKKNIKPYTYLPFGLGPRNCIGSRFALLEIKALFFLILRHFEIVPVEKTPIPLKISKKSLNLRAEGGFWVGLKRITT
ncbi:hypothetical protein NQ317_013393 [Molorchus minor]|uniref:Cytochrome P450 n=1 Tax=Molorchus minor TaxID=1323400 RepID=A0ABQ9J7Q6_9CUCU|nr:hypothetical protein NQ317_013393 [Molorchus minor]